MFNVFSNEGEVLLAERAVRTPWSLASGWTCRLYKNDYTPTKDVTLASVVEADFPGYAPVPMDATLWAPFRSVNGLALSFYDTAPTQFPATSGTQVVYGYYVTDDDSGILIWAGRFDASQIVTNLAPGLVLPAFSLHSEIEP